jgi:hypothetical protein
MCGSVLLVPANPGDPCGAVRQPSSCCPDPAVRASGSKRKCECEPTLETLIVDVDVDVEARSGATRGKEARPCPRPYTFAPQHLADLGKGFSNRAREYR